MQQGYKFLDTMILNEFPLGSVVPIPQGYMFPSNSKRKDFEKKARDIAHMTKKLKLNQGEVKKPRKVCVKKPGPSRKKCVWCSLTHGHSCSADRCAVREKLGGIGSDELLERCRVLRAHYGEQLRVALERYGEMGVRTLEKAYNSESTSSDEKKPVDSDMTPVSGSDSPTIQVSAQRDNPEYDFNSMYREHLGEPRVEIAAAPQPVMIHHNNNNNNNNILPQFNQLHQMQLQPQMQMPQMHVFAVPEQEAGDERLRLLSLICANADARL